MKKIALLFGLGLILSIVACDSSSDNGTVKVTVEEDDGTKKTYESETPASVEEAMEKVTDILKDMDNVEDVDIVNFRDLQSLLKDNLVGFQRSEKEGETTGAAGIEISIARGIYEGDKGEVEVEIIDTGGLGMAVMASAAWASAKIDRETSNGYERTTTIHGHKGYEEWDKNKKSGSVAVIIGKRFIVNLDGDEIDDPAILKKMAAAIDLKKLEKMGK